MVTWGTSSPRPLWYTHSCWWFMLHFPKISAIYCQSVEAQESRRELKSYISKGTNQKPGVTLPKGTVKDIKVSKCLKQALIKFLLHTKYWLYNTLCVNSLTRVNKVVKLKTQWPLGVIECPEVSDLLAQIILKRLPCRKQWEDPGATQMIVSEMHKLMEH